MLRLPATPVRSLICFASGVHAILLGSCLAACAPRRSEVSSGPGSLFSRRPDLPVCSHVDVNGTSQVPRRSIPCLSPLFDPGRTDDPSPIDGFVDAAPALPTAKASAFNESGAQSRGFGTCCLRFKSDVATTHAKLASGWLACLCREGVEPSGPLQKVSDHISRPPFLDLSWRKGSFIASLRLMPAALITGHRFRCLPIGRKYPLPQIGEPSANRRIGHG